MIICTCQLLCITINGGKNSFSDQAGGGGGGGGAPPPAPHLNTALGVEQSRILLLWLETSTTVL